ncbi:hypothetical protein [Pseudomonas sp. HY7a-MNA-CIBAN-0227]|uniref:hypothetical protein n=1 Tax=Pseudomonas sp. HY7a-MNA-CIBAN-0227 TaxID=3140474 RepID=UPI00331813F7
MKFEDNIENSFAKAIRNDNFSVNMQALKMASNARAEGSEIDFVKIIDENEISDRLADLLIFAPFDDHANFGLYQGGHIACRHFYEIAIAKPKSPDDENYVGQEERWAILENIDGYMSNINGVSGNLKARHDLNISKTQYEMYNKMLEADAFDISIALSIHKISVLLDQLSPEYVKNFMTNEDVKAIVTTLDDEICEDIVYSELEREVGRFVKAKRLSNKKAPVLFSVMTTYANAIANGETEQEILQHLNDSNLIDKAAVDRYSTALEAKSKVVVFAIAQTVTPDKPFKALAERIDESVLTDGEKTYFTELLESGAATHDEVEYIKEMLDKKNVSDEESKLMDEFDRMYEDEIEGVRKKKFGLKTR